MSGMASYPVEKEKKAKQEKKKKRFKIEQQISPALFDTHTQQPATRPTHTTTLHTHTRTREKETRLFAV
jgi:hypothetical protein